MKKKIIGIVIISLLAVLAITGVNYAEKKAYKIVKIENETIELYDKFVFRNYDQLEKYGIYTTELEKKDFDNHNYIFLKIKYDTCSEKNIRIKEYKVNNRNITVNLEYEDYCDSCEMKELYYLLKINKEITDPIVEYNKIKINNNRCNDIGEVEKKPIIYLYPEEETKVDVKLINDQLITSSYPKYEKSWNVTAYPDGKLIDNKTNRKLYGLYWEGKKHKSEIKSDGFIVEGKNTIEFLEEKLEILGLNEYETEEFIIYWLPELEKNKYNYIRFESEEEINSYMPIEVTPKPDTLIRIVMDYKPLDKKINVKDQTLTTKERKGFTLVEWGGVKIN